MKKQTYIIVLNKDKIGDPSHVYDFFRVGCKRKETALRYLKNWKKQAIERGWKFLYPCFFCEGAKYEIIETPNGYDCETVVYSGYMSDL